MRVAPMLLIVVLCPSLRSQPPIPTPTKRGQAQQDTRNDKGSSGKADATKRQSLPSNSDEILSKDRGTPKGNHGSNTKGNPTGKNGDWKISEILITFFTGVLAVLAGLQFWAMHRQADYMRRGLRISIRQARIASRNALAAKHSAEIAEKTMLLTECADILVEGLGFSTERNLFPETVTSITIKNYGRTRADEVDVHFWLRVPEASGVQNPELPTILLGPGENFTALFPPLKTFMDESTFRKDLLG